MLPHIDFACMGQSRLEPGWHYVSSKLLWFYVKFSWMALCIVKTVVVLGEIFMDAAFRFDTMK